MLATEYAADYDIDPQGPEESNSSFRHRVAGELRDQNYIVEAHEVQADSRHDAADGNALTGLMGLVSMALSAQTWESSGERLVGDEIAVGTIIQHQMSPAGQAQERSDAALASMLQIGMDPEGIYAMSKPADHQCKKAL